MESALKAISKGDELRYGPLGMHKMSLGCFESGSKKKFSRPLVIDFFQNLRIKNRDFGGA